MAELRLSGPGKYCLHHAFQRRLKAKAAKREELTRLMGILEADFNEKNLLPPRKPVSTSQCRLPSRRLAHCTCREE